MTLPGYSNKPGNGSTLPEYGMKPGNGSTLPEYGNKPGNGNALPDYANKPSNGNNNGETTGAYAGGIFVPVQKSEPMYSAAEALCHGTAWPSLRDPYERRRSCNG